MLQNFIDTLQQLFVVFLSFDILVYITIILLGAIIGSFLNVVIYRTPIMIEFEYADMIKANSDSVHSHVEDAYMKGNGLTLSLPRSRCSCCGKQIPWYHNIPILSYFILQGKCYNCRESFSFRYPLIEIIHTLSWVGLFYIFGATLTFLVTAILFSLILSMSMIDFDHKILPDNLVFLTACLGLLFSTTEYSLINTETAIYHSLIAFFCSHIFISTYSKLRGQLMMGFGDIKLIGALTLFIGLNNFLYALIIACLVGIIYYIIILFSKKLDEDKTFAFGPFICIGFYSLFIYYLI